MTDDRDEATGFATLPIQPTGSGVADLEIQREKDALARGESDVDALDPPAPRPMDDAADLRAPV